MNKKEPVETSISILNELVNCDFIPKEYEEDSLKAINRDNLKRHFIQGRELYIDSSLEEEEEVLGVFTYLNEGHKHLITDALHIRIKSNGAFSNFFELILKGVTHQAPNLEILEDMLFEWALEVGLLND